MKKNIFFININEKILILFLILFSLLINQYYGNKGVLPMDSFFVFDSGYYVLNDIHPFKDYWSITGPTLDYLQALFFLIFGTNWFGYVLHASIVNLVLTVFSYLVFVNLGLNKIYSFIYSLGIALLAYPNIGVPFVDHHSTIFSVLAIYCFILGIKKENNFFWFFIPLLLGLSFFSKQIPAAYIIILLTATSFFYFFYKFNKKNIYFLLAGISFTILFFSFFFIINEIPFNNFLIQYIFYPLSLGNQRYENLNISFNSVVEQFKFIYLCLIPMILVLIKILRKNIKKKLENIDALVIFSVIVATLIFIYTQLLTSNQILIFFLIPIVTAFSHIYFSKYHKKKYFLYLIIFLCEFD